MAPHQSVPLPVYHRGDDFYLYERHLRSAIALVAPHAVSFLDGTYPLLPTLESPSDPAAQFNAIRTAEADRATVATLLRQSLAPALRPWLDTPTGSRGDDPTQMWRSIARRFGRPDQMRLRALETQIEALRIEDLASMSAVLDEWQELTARHSGTLNNAKANAHDVFEPELYVGRERIMALRRLGKLHDHAQRVRWDTTFIEALKNADERAVAAPTDASVDAIYDEAYIELVLTLESIEERHCMGGTSSKLSAMPEQSVEEEEQEGDATAVDLDGGASATGSTSRRSYMRPLSIVGLPISQQVAVPAGTDSPIVATDSISSRPDSLRAALSPLTYHPPTHERPRPHSVALLSPRDWAPPPDSPQADTDKPPANTAERRASIIDSGYAGSNASLESPNGGGHQPAFQTLAFRRTPGTRPRSLFIPGRSRSGTLLETIHARPGEVEEGSFHSGNTPPMSARRVSSPGAAARSSIGSLRSPHWNMGSRHSTSGEVRTSPGGRRSVGGVSRESVDHHSMAPPPPGSAAEASASPHVTAAAEPTWPGWREYAQGLGLDASLLYGSGVGGSSVLSPTARFRTSRDRSRAPSFSARPRSLSFISPPSSRHASPRVDPAWLLPEWPSRRSHDASNNPTYADVALGVPYGAGDHGHGYGYGSPLIRRSASDDHGRAVSELRAIEGGVKEGAREEAHAEDALGLTFTTTSAASSRTKQTPSNLPPKPTSRVSPRVQPPPPSATTTTTVTRQHPNPHPPGTRLEAETQTERQTGPDGTMQPTRMFKKNRRPPRGNKTRSGLPKVVQVPPVEGGREQGKAALAAESAGGAEGDVGAAGKDKGEVTGRSATPVLTPASRRGASESEREQNSAKASGNAERARSRNATTSDVRVGAGRS